MDHHLFANIKRVNIHEAEGSKAIIEAEATKAEAQESKVEVEHLRKALKEVQRNFVEAKHFREALKKVEQTLIEIRNILEANLASKIKKKKKAKAELFEGEKRVNEAKK